MSQETSRNRRSESGQTMPEYAVVLTVITIAIVTSYGLLADAIQGLLETVVGLFS